MDLAVAGDLAPFNDDAADVKRAGVVDDALDRVARRSEGGAADAEEHEVSSCADGYAAQVWPSQGIGSFGGGGMWAGSAVVVSAGALVWGPT